MSAPLAFTGSLSEMYDRFFIEPILKAWGRADTIRRFSDGVSLTFDLSSDVAPATA